MKNELELEAIIEDYLDGKLSEEEARAFEQLRITDPTVDHKVVAHKVFLDSLKAYGTTLSLKDKMDAVHATINVEEMAREVKPHSSILINLWRNNKSAIAIAASFILLTVVSIYSIQHNTKQNGSYEMMRRELVKMQRSQSNLIRNLKNNSKADTAPVRPAKFGGTGFALTSNGYLCTNLHVISGADSIYVQNSFVD